MVDLIERLDEVGILSCLAKHIFLYSILENRVDFCSHLCMLWFSPSHRKIFLVTHIRLHYIFLTFQFDVHIYFL
jgi:hypothetical protein